MRREPSHPLRRPVHLNGCLQNVEAVGAMRVTGLEPARGGPIKDQCPTGDLAQRVCQFHHTRRKGWRRPEGRPHRVNHLRRFHA